MTMQMQTFGKMAFLGDEFYAIYALPESIP